MYHIITALTLLLNEDVDMAVVHLPFISSFSIVSHLAVQDSPNQTAIPFAHAQHAFAMRLP